MKALSLIISLLVFAVSGYFFISDFSLSAGSNHLIYMSLLVILMLVCVVGIMINVPLIVSERRKMKALVYKNLTVKARTQKHSAWQLKTT